MNYFRAPWGLSLILTSAVGTAVCGAVAALLATRVLAYGPGKGPLWAALLPVFVLAGCALFTVRGYMMVPGAIYVRRLLWNTRLLTYGLQSVTFEPNVMRWSVRVLGNGGLFAFSGRYWSRTLGSYHAYVTDPKRTVVLRYPARTVVLSPDWPEQFVHDLASTDVR